MAPQQRLPSLLGCLALAGLLLGTPAVASAQTSPTSDATLHYNQGYDAMMRGDRDRAYAELTQAWRLQQTSETAGLLGQVERKLCLDRSPTTYCDLYVDAARHLSFALATLPETARADTLAKVKAWLAEVKLQVGTLQLEAPTGAEVSVDGKTVGVAPIKEEVFVVPGTHTVVARANGAQLASEHIDIAKGGVQTVRLLPANSAEVASKGSSPNIDSPVSPKPNGAQRPSLVPAYVLGGVVVVSLGAGFIFRASANSAERTGKDLASGIPADGCAATPRAANCDAIRSEAESHDAKTTASNVSFIAAGVSAAAAIGYATYALWPRRESSTTAAMSFDSHGTTIQISGSF